MSGLTHGFVVAGYWGEIVENVRVLLEMPLQTRKRSLGLKSARLAAEAAAFGVLEGSRAIFWGQYMRLCLHYLYMVHGYPRCDVDHTCV